MKSKWKDFTYAWDVSEYVHFAHARRHVFALRGPSSIHISVLLLVNDKSQLNGLITNTTVKQYWGLDTVVWSLSKNKKR